MISYLNGIYKYSGDDHLIVEVNGIGYKVFVPASVLYKVPLPDEKLTVHTHMYVREDAMQLYGFLEQEELELFEILIQVSGIGPKVALGVLSAMPAASFKQAVLNEQIAALTQVPGIGKKTAQRMILELKDKLSKLSTDNTVSAVPLPVTPISDEAVEALVALGYGNAEAKKSISKILKSSPDISVEDIIKKALIEMAKF